MSPILLALVVTAQPPLGYEDRPVVLDYSVRQRSGPLVSLRLEIGRRRECYSLPRVGVYESREPYYAPRYEPRYEPRYAVPSYAPRYDPRCDERCYSRGSYSFENGRSVRPSYYGGGCVDGRCPYPR